LHPESDGPGPEWRVVRRSVSFAAADPLTTAWASLTPACMLPCAPPLWVGDTVGPAERWSYGKDEFDRQAPGRPGPPCPPRK